MHNLCERALTEAATTRFFSSEISPCAKDPDLVHDLATIVLAEPATFHGTIFSHQV